MKFLTPTLCFMGAQAVQLGQWSMPMNLAQTQTQVTGLVMAQINADCPTWAMDSKAQIGADCPVWAMDHKAQIDRRDVEGVLDSAERDDE